MLEQNVSVLFLSFFNITFIYFSHICHYLFLWVFYTLVEVIKVKPTIMCMQRREKKYLLTKQKYELLINRLKDRIVKDEYAKSTICNIYYDTDQFDLIENSVQKPMYKEKFRIRSYGIPKNDSNVFLEIKRKCKGVVNKRRIVIPFNKLNEDISSDLFASQIGKEIHYMLNFYKPEPKVFIAYDRLAFKGIEDSSLRITFDFNIRSRFDHLDLSYGDNGIPLLKNDECLMEIKVNQVYPLWLVSILSDLEIYPVSFSKYGKIYTNMLMTKGNNLCSQV